MRIFEFDFWYKPKVYYFKRFFFFFALVGVAQWIERRPANQRVAGSLPSQGTCLACGPSPQ